MSKPVFSVIVPTFNRPSQVSACLSALASIDYEKHAIEVILVDDGGACELEAIVEQFKDRLPVRLERQANRGPASARNRGAECATGEFLAFTDDDCEPDRAWLRALEEWLRRCPRHAIGGQIVNVATDDVFATAGQSILDSLYSHYNRKGKRPRFFASNNIAVPADLFRHVGGFHAGFPLAAGEDREFCHRWLQGGFGLAYAQQAVVRHCHRMGIREYWNQHLHYGRGAFQYRKITQKSGESYGFEPLAFYAGILRRPFRESSGWQSMRLGAAVVLSQLAVASGFLREAVANALRSSAVSPDTL